MCKVFTVPLPVQWIDSNNELLVTITIKILWIKKYNSVSIFVFLERESSGRISVGARKTPPLQFWGLEGGII